MANRITIACLTAGLLCGALASESDAQLRLHTRLFKSNKAGTKFTPFAAGANATFQVTLRLYEDPNGIIALQDEYGDDWSETLTIRIGSKDPKATAFPHLGQFIEPTPIKGELDVILGASKLLPDGLSGGSSWFTTQVGTLNANGKLTKHFAESPLQLMGQGPGDGPQGPQGPMGPQGLTGDVGPAGPEGLEGPEGEIGPVGPQGLQGDLGPAGPQGLQGDIGPAGPQGLQGDIGPAGPQGLQGDIGPAGPQGLQGDIGPAGAQGLQGDIGPAGPQGLQGDIGPAGPQGLQGDIGPAGPQGLQGDIGPAGPQGLQGDIGPAGPQGLQGDIGPAGPQGLQGDVGPAGPQGLQGDIGPAGPQGLQGDIGPAGAQGLQGDVGPAGPQGLQGDIGPAGPQGPQGDAGPAGPQGLAGLLGATGPQGLAGPAGPQGDAGPVGPQGATGTSGTSSWSDDLTDVSTNLAVGIGTDAPDAALEIATDVQHGLLSHSTYSFSGGYGGRFVTDSPSGSGVQGQANTLNGTTFGVLGLSASTSGRGVYGIGTSTTGTSYGLFGVTLSNAGTGVLGTATSGIGETFGGRFQTSSSDGTGVLATSTTAGGVALRAENLAGTSNVIEASSTGSMRFRVAADGNVYADVAFNGGGADYAEWLRRADATEVFEPGDVVGIFAGTISHDTDGAQQILAISTNPVVVGNAANAADDDREGYEKVAFLGQVPVKVRGPVAAGDFIIASGLGDGTALAIAPRQMTAERLPRVLGTAWESFDGKGIQLVNTAIGVDQLSAAVSAMTSVQQQLSSREAELGQLTDRVSQLEWQIAQVLGSSN